MADHFIFGYGFLGQRLADQLRAHGQSVWTVTRSPEKAQRLAAEGIVARVADHKSWASLSGAGDLPRFQSITVCVGNDGRMATDHRSIYTAATEAALVLAGHAGSAAPAAGLTTAASHILFASTTGVYRGDRPDDPAKSAETTAACGAANRPDGEQGPDNELGPIVDEDWPVSPDRPGAVASWQCETLLRERAPRASTVFRLAGLYSLARIPNLARLRNQELIPGSAEGSLNLIHVRDAAAILATAALAPPPWSVINVADGQPVPRRTFYEFLANKYGLAPPRFAEAGGRGTSRKRLDTTRLRQWYGGPWLYPNYQQGLSDPADEGGLRD
jgi:nucleoside-diphosphate-sugar epimerase